MLDYQDEKDYLGAAWLDCPVTKCMYENLRWNRTCNLCIWTHWRPLGMQPGCTQVSWLHV